MDKGRQSLKKNQKKCAKNQTGRPHDGGGDNRVYKQKKKRIKQLDNEG